MIDDYLENVKDKAEVELKAYTHLQLEGNNDQYGVLD